MTSYCTLHVPMPIMGSADAPQFNGECVNEFLQAIEQCGENAGISNLDDLVPYIQWYSTEDVKEVICCMPEFDNDIPNKTWSNATTTLHLLYGASDDIGRATPSGPLKGGILYSSTGTYTKQVRWLAGIRPGIDSTGWNSKRSKSAVSRDQIQ